MTYNLRSKILHLFLISFILMGCKSQKNSSYHDIIIGYWAYIDPEGQYSEMYIDSNEIFSQPDHGPFNYSIVNNKITFNNTFYYIEIIDCNSFKFINPDYNLLFEKINIDKSISKDDLFNGFFLRKCCFLVNKGRLSIEEAHEALTSYRFNDFENIETEEEIISH